MGWVTYGSSRLILVGLGNLGFLQVNPFPSIMHNRILIINREALRRVVLDVRSVYARLFAAGTSFVTI